MNKLFFSLACGFCLAVGSAIAGPADYNQAVKDYRDGHYAKALAEFDNLKASFPTNALVRYYSGLCLQATGQYGRAKSEFSFVADCDDARLRSLAQAGLNQLNSVHTKSSAPATASLNAATSSITPPKAPPVCKVKKVLEFSAVWCRSCQEFAPTFEAVKSDTPNVQFEQYSIDDPEGKAIANNYPFPTIPYVVFLDESGNVLYTGGPRRTVDSFKEQIYGHR